MRTWVVLLSLVGPGLRGLVFVSRFAKMAVISDCDTFMPCQVPPYCHFRTILPRKRLFGGICAVVDVSRFEKSPEISNRDTFFGPVDTFAQVFA